MKKRIQKLEKALAQLQVMIDAREKELQTLLELRSSIIAMLED